jgi:WD40 repeat protein
VWDLHTGELINPLEGHSGVVHSVAISPDNSKIVSGSGSWDETIKVWDLNTGTPLNTLGGHSGVVYLPFMVAHRTNQRPYYIPSPLLY